MLVARVSLVGLAVAVLAVGAYAGALPKLPAQPDGTMAAWCEGAPLVVLAYDYDPPREDRWLAVEFRLPKDPRPFAVFYEDDLYVDLDGDGQVDETMTVEQWMQDPREICDIAAAARARRR